MKKRIVYILSCTLIFIVGYGIYKLYFEKRGASMQLPKPTGSLAVGTTTYHLIDTHRYERHSNNSSDHRELMLQIWYPTPLNNEKKTSYAHPGVIELLIKWLEEQAHIPAKKLDYLNTLKTHATDNTPILTGHYPVIIFSPGWGGPVSMYTSLLEELASHGYVVVGINYPYVTSPVVFPDGRIINALEPIQDKTERRKDRETEYLIWIEDVRFVTEQLASMNAEKNSSLFNKLDLKRLGIFGHSFGGSVAVGVCQMDNRFAAGIDIDGKLHRWNQRKTLTVPFMFVVASHSDETLQPIRELLKSAAAPTEYIEVPKADHGSFTDLYVIAKWDLLGPHNTWLI